MGKNVAVFVDVANIFYAAKAAGVDIDYVTLLKSATAGRDFVRAYAYTGLDPDNENQRNFHSFLARNSYKVVSKDIRKYGDGKVKANLDIELVVDLMKTARNLDIAIVVSGDGDFAPAIRAVQEQGVRVEVISFRGNTSSDLIEVADLFTDITQLARVEKGSSRSGRRVAGDEEDLSMTEVPDKQTEGTGPSRGRGRGRGRGRPGEAEPVAPRSRGGSTSRDVAAAAGLTVLPGEKLSRVGAAPAAEDADETELDDVVATAADETAMAESATDGENADAFDADGRRRRRRRGGRGRGRGRGREQEPGAVGVVGDETASTGDQDEDEDEDEAPPQIAAAPRGPRTTPFGSVWDSQLGVPTATSTPAPLGPVSDDEDFEEPEIPEYLIAEQRRGQGARQGQGGRQGQGSQGRGGPRGGRAAYTAAIDRERYGRGGGGGGINRYPDVSGRERTGGASRGRPSEPAFGRQDRAPRPDRGERPAAPRSSEPWSEVPEDLQEMLRAQLAQSGKGSAPRVERQPARPAVTSEAPVADALAADAAIQEPAAPARRRATRSKAVAESAVPSATPESATAGAAEDAPKKRAPRRKAEAATAAADSTSAADSDAAATAEPETAPKRRATRAKSTAEPGTTTRTRRTAGASVPVVEDTAPLSDGEGPAAAPTKRRTTRKKAEPATETD